MTHGRAPLLVNLVVATLAEEFGEKLTRLARGLRKEGR
jgi:hypothetical protein